MREADQDSIKLRTLVLMLFAMIAFSIGSLYCAITTGKPSTKISKPEISRPLR